MYTITSRYYMTQMLCINKNDPNTGKPKSSRSSKWALVKPFWVERPSHKVYDKLEFVGKGVVCLSEDPVVLTNRLQLLIAEYNAGNTTTRNEIVAITDELKRKDIIDSEQYKALKSCLF